MTAAPNQPPKMEQQVAKKPQTPKELLDQLKKPEVTKPVTRDEKIAARTKAEQERGRRAVAEHAARPRPAPEPDPTIGQVVEIQPRVPGFKDKGPTVKVLVSS